ESPRLFGPTGHTLHQPACAKRANPGMTSSLPGRTLRGAAVDVIGNRTRRADIERRCWPARPLTEGQNNARLIRIGGGCSGSSRAEFAPGGLMNRFAARSRAV